LILSICFSDRFLAVYCPNTGIEASKL
jgi:hypothetical protein